MIANQQTEKEMNKTEITIVVEGGVVVDVTGLPAGWLYRIEDHDVEEQYDPQYNNRIGFRADYFLPSGEGTY